jgi:alkylation response protein AidB-like acyl-CoA dehydrogenase
MIELTDEQRMMLESIDDIARNEFQEKAFDWADELPWEHVEILADNGFFGVNFSEAYGGGGMSEFEAVLMIELVGRVCPDTASFLVNQQLVAPRAIEMFGTEAAKQRYLPPVLNADEYIAIAISEPDAGSDVKSMTTTVEEHEDSLLMNGEKVWVSDFDEASAIVTWVKFPEGLGSVVIDTDSPGVDVASHSRNMAGRTQSHFYLNDVEIPAENVLVRGRDAFKKQLQALNWERIGGATLANTLALAALERALEYAGEREQFGTQIGDFQGMEWKLADLARDVELSRAYTFQAAKHAVDSGRIPDSFRTSIAKLYAGEMAESVVSDALQVFGARGYQEGHPVEYLYRFARGRQIAGGTSEIQRNFIASRLKENGISAII